MTGSKHLPLLDSLSQSAGLGERLYDATSLVTIRKGEGISHDPFRERGLRNFEAVILARVTCFSTQDLGSKT